MLIRNIINEVIAEPKELIRTIREATGIAASVL
jgi:hypothetical protein